MTYELFSSKPVAEEVSMRDALARSVQTGPDDFIGDTIKLRRTSITDAKALAAASVPGLAASEVKQPPQSAEVSEHEERVRTAVQVGETALSEQIERTPELVH